MNRPKDKAWRAGNYIMVACRSRRMDPDEAISLAYSLVTAASKIDPLAEAKFRGHAALDEIKPRLGEIRKWAKVKGFKKALAAFKEKRGYAPEKWAIYHFFSSKNTVVGPWEPIPYELTLAQQKCRSPIDALKEGDVDACMRAIALDWEMGS